jgi:CHASE2 domain-containing sensor protein
MTDFRLKIWRVEQTCIFELAWEAGLQITAQLAYPESLTQLYQDWQTSYLNFYSRSLRARVQGSGDIAAPPIDARAQLVEAEARFLSAFHFWLSSAELLGVRSQIAKAAIAQQTADADPEGAIEICLTCEPLELARFPWEAWEIGTEFGTNRTIRIARTPANLRKTASPRQSRRQLRILAILGDDTGLDFHTDRQAMASLGKQAEVVFVGWQAGRDPEGLKETIATAIADPQGWDILFFAGHSNETSITGGELTIAPNVSILVQEIAPQLIQARDRGLQFAIFNSCSGLSIANSLVDLGLSQVAIMREPIHNRVAQEFLLRFLQHFSEYCDVHTAMLRACEFLKLDRNLTYPSAYLIPSLYRHPEAVPFRLQRRGLQTWLQSLRPTRQQTLGLLGCTLISVLPPMQNLMLEARVAVQSVYRHRTQQLPKNQPQILLIQVDEDSIRGLDARKINPIDRTYLAQVIDQTRTLQGEFKPSVIGIDFLLDRPTPEDPVLAAAVRRSIETNQWLLFAAQLNNNGRELGAIPEIANPRATLQGHIGLYLNYVELPVNQDACQKSCPFGYLIALADQSRTSSTPPRPDGQDNARDRLLATTTPEMKKITQNQLAPITPIAERLGQLWLRPIIDYSIPSQQVYQTISAGDFLSHRSRPNLPSAPIVMIAAGGYEEAGISQVGEDVFPLPLALRYWNDGKHQNGLFTGAETHAYMIDQLRRSHRIIPIPALWCIGLATIVGTLIRLLGPQVHRQRNFSRRQRVLGQGAIAGLYGIGMLQLYIGAGLLVPIGLPAVIVWLYARRPKS